MVDIELMVHGNDILDLDGLFRHVEMPFMPWDGMVIRVADLSFDVREIEFTVETGRIAVTAELLYGQIGAETEEQVEQALRAVGFRGATEDQL